jgi:putative oxidoreductase
LHFDVLRLRFPQQPKGNDEKAFPILGAAARGAADHDVASSTFISPSGGKENMLNPNQCKSWMHSHPDVMMDLVRIYLGVALFFKGVYFMANRDALMKLMEDSGNWMLAPATIAHYILPAHLLGGILLAVGLLTRWAALAQIPILVGAVLYVHLPKLTLMGAEPRQNLELSCLVLFLTCLVFLHGSGRFSVDHMLDKSEDHGRSPLPRPA